MVDKRKKKGEEVDAPWWDEAETKEVKKREETEVVDMPLSEDAPVISEERRNIPRRKPVRLAGEPETDAEREEEKTAAEKARTRDVEESTKERTDEEVEKKARAAMGESGKGETVPVAGYTIKDEQ